MLGRSGGVFVLSREPNALEVLDRRKPQERKRRRPLAGGRLANLLGQAGLSSAIKLRSVSPAFDPFLAQRIELSHRPESDNCEVMIKRVGEPYSRTLHDDEASCVDSRQFVHAENIPTTAADDSASAIHAPLSTKTASLCRITARRERYRGRANCA